jgi:group I intron endonuclease
MIIYKITNKINNKVYIGQTTQSLKKRFQVHCGIATRNYGISYINRSICKHGKENFIIDEIDSAANIEELNEKEKYWISFYNSTNPEFGYNLMSGGNNSKHSEETKKLISEKKKNPSIETRKKMSLAAKQKDLTKQILAMKKSNTGRVRTKEHQEKLANTQRGRKVSEETRQKMREAKRKTGKDRKPMSQETKDKIRKALTGRKLSEDHKRAVSIGQLGRKVPEEVRKKMSDSHLKRRLNEENRS